MDNTVENSNFQQLNPALLQVETADQESQAFDFADNDVLSGRGAFVNSQNGNLLLRSLCFANKTQFDAGNPAAKRRLAIEIVRQLKTQYGSRFLKRETSASPWIEMDDEAAQQKAQQIMRDYRRPDREERDKRVKKRNRSTATPLLDDAALPLPGFPIEPIVEMPEGVHAHDVLFGRGGFVASHVGNHTLRKLAGERKAQFDVGSYTEKRSLAAEIVQTIRELDPPGRFLQKRPSIKDDDDDAAAAASSSGWEEVSDETAIRKANQAMRDINRPDREHRLQRKRQRLLAKEDKQKAKKEAREKLLIEKVPNSHILFHHHESSDDIFRNQMVAEALDSALGSLGSVPIPHMESS